MTYEQELEMEKKAFDRGIVRINLDTFVGYNEAKQLAEELAGGLPTKEEFEQSEVNGGDNQDLWMYYVTEKGEADVIQIGNHHCNPKRYLTHMEQWGKCTWLFGPRCFGHWRALGFIYAK